MKLVLVYTTKSSAFAYNCVLSNIFMLINRLCWFSISLSWFFKSVNVGLLSRSFSQHFIIIWYNLSSTCCGLGIRFPSWSRLQFFCHPFVDTVNHLYKSNNVSSLSVKPQARLTFYVGIMIAASITNEVTACINWWKRHVILKTLLRLKAIYKSC